MQAEDKRQTSRWLSRDGHVAVELVDQGAEGSLGEVFGQLGEASHGEGDQALAGPGGHPVLLVDLAADQPRLGRLGLSLPLLDPGRFLVADLLLAVVALQAQGDVVQGLVDVTDGLIGVGGEGRDRCAVVGPQDRRSSRVGEQAQQAQELVVCPGCLGQQVPPGPRACQAESRRSWG